MAITKLYTVTMTDDTRAYLMHLLALEPHGDQDADDAHDALDRATLAATFITPEEE